MYVYIDIYIYIYIYIFPGHPSNSILGVPQVACNSNDNKTTMMILMLIIVIIIIIIMIAIMQIIICNHAACGKAELRLSPFVKVLRFDVLVRFRRNYDGIP